MYPLSFSYLSFINLFSSQIKQPSAPNSPHHPLSPVFLFSLWGKCTICLLSTWSPSSYFSFSTCSHLYQHISSFAFFAFSPLSLSRPCLTNLRYNCLFYYYFRLYLQVYIFIIIPLEFKVYCKCNKCNISKAHSYPYIHWELCTCNTYMNSGWRLHSCHHIGQKALLTIKWFMGLEVCRHSSS